MRINEFEKIKDEFSRAFEPFVISIQTHGMPYVYQAKPNLDTYLVSNEDKKTYINANLMRNQMDGILNYFKILGFKEHDFSNTGAARTVELKTSKLISKTKYQLGSVCNSILPDLKMDYVPQFKIPFEYLPERLRHWTRRSSALLTPAIKHKIKSRGGIAVAKSHNGEMSKTLWRISISPMDLFNEYSCSNHYVLDALVIFKDLRIVALSRISKYELTSYHIKTALLWCMEEIQEKSRKNIVNVTLLKLSSFFRKKFLPDYFDESCNLIDNVKDDVAIYISVAIEQVLKNINFWVLECQMRQNVMKQTSRENLVTLSSFKAMLIKIGLRSMIKYPFVAKHILIRRISRYLLKQGCPKEDLYALCRTEDVKLHALCTEMIIALLSATIKLLD